jgi:hypothetical protein
MGVEHDGITFPIDRHCRVMGLSIRRFFFPYQMNDTSWKKKLLKPPWIWKKGGEDSPLPFAPDQKAVGPADEAGSYRVIEKAFFPDGPFMSILINILFYQKKYNTHPLDIGLSFRLKIEWENNKMCKRCGFQQPF